MAEKNVDEMNFLQHLEELRWRIIRSALAILILAFAMWFIKDWIIENIFISMTKNDFPSYTVLCKYFHLCLDQIPIQLQSNKVAAQFSYALFMCIAGGVILAFPYIFYQFWAFIKPGLKPKEKKAISGIIVFVSILFFMGVLFGYYIVAPLCVQFFGAFSLNPKFQNFWKIDSFMSLILSSVLYSGLLFLLPVLIYILTKIGLITPAFLKKYRRHAIIAILIISAIITPPNFITQIIVSIPIIILYEFSIFMSKYVEKKKQKEMMEETMED